MRAWLLAHKKLLVMCARTGCPKHGKRWRRQFNRSGNTRRLRQLRQRRKVKRWTTRLKSMLQKKEFKSHPSNVGMTGRPRLRRERNQPPRLRLRRQILPTGLPVPVTRRKPFHPASLWWEDPGPTAAQCLPGPTDLNAIDHAVVMRSDEVTGRTDITTHQGPGTRQDVEGVGSGPGPRLREGPALEPGTLTQRMLRGLAVLRGGQRRSGLLVLPLYHQSHHSRLTADRWSRSWSQHHDRRESVGSVRSGTSYVSRREVQLSPVTPQQAEKRTITVISLPPRPAEMDDSAEVTGPADSAALGDSAGVTGPSDSGEAHNSAGYESAGELGSIVEAEPQIVYDSVNVADSAQDQDPAGADSAQPQDSAGDDSARGDGSAAQGTPVARQDNSMVSDVSSLMFPSLPGSVNQETFVDFMSMWTLMQGRMDSGMAAPDTQSKPVDQTPTTRHDQTPPRRSGIPVRRSRTPDRRPRTPVRRARGMDESRNSTRSRSPIRRSSFSESCTRDASPVDFSAALNTEDKVKDRTISEDADDEGSQKKVSAAQYQLLRQAMTSSKGTFKVNPSKSRRAPRASLMDLGESEVSDRVSWLDQPSLVDTMASTARIAHGLKEDEDVEKTTLSEMLNTSSSTLKHLTVKQIFPREPYRLKVHRDAQYLPKPSAENGFSDSKAPSSYQISLRMCLDTWGVGTEISHLRLPCGFDGGIRDWRAVTERSEI